LAAALISSALGRAPLALAQSPLDADIQQAKTRTHMTGVHADRGAAGTDDRHRAALLR